MTECCEPACGTSTALEDRLTRLGIRDGSELLEAGSTAADRRALAEVLGVELEKITDAIDRADLARAECLDTMSIDLLARAGVRSLQALAACSPRWLHTELAGLRFDPAVPASAPDLETVTRWVTRARSLPVRVRP